VKRLLRAYRLSPVGGGVVLVLGAAILVLAVGPQQDRTPAVVTLVALIALLCVRGAPGWLAWVRGRGGSHRGD
jgi:hypothetical protein